MRLPSDPERALVLAYAAADRRAALAALFRLDEALGQALRGAREPLLAQMRLTWWHEALTGLETAPSPAEPALTDLLADKVVPFHLTGSALSRIAEGWELLLEAELTDSALADYAAARGGGLFSAAAQVLGGEFAGIGDAGAGWALVDLARHSSEPGLAARALVLARPMLERARAGRWPRSLRALGALAVLALRDAERGPDGLEPAGHPARMLRALRHRLTGR